LEVALNSTWNTAGTLTFATNSIVRVVGGTPSGSTPYTLVVAATSISTNTMPILSLVFQVGNWQWWGGPIWCSGPRGVEVIQLRLTLLGSAVHQLMWPGVLPIPMRGRQLRTMLTVQLR
jgi:hypothetical protein